MIGGTQAQKELRSSIAISVNMDRPAAAALFLLLVLFVFECYGWGEPGHRITGRIADFYSTNTTRTAVQKILGGASWWQYTDSWPLGAIAYPDTYGWTTPGAWSLNLHFADTHNETFFLYNRDCYATCDSTVAPSGYCTLNQTLLDCCVVGAIEKYSEELWLQLVKGQTNASSGVNNTDDPLLKLMMLAHFVGDIHQPLHVDSKNDEGGNQYFIQWYGNSTCGSGNYTEPCKLHVVWDTLMINKRLSDFGPPPRYPYEDPREETLANAIVQLYDPLYGQFQYEIDPSYWATESVSLADMTYLVPAGGVINDNYYNNSLPVVELQLWKAGRRLAEILNFLFPEDGETEDCMFCHWWNPLCRPASPQQR